jgi:hypothetical protein
MKSGKVWGLIFLIFIPLITILILTNWYIGGFNSKKDVGEKMKKNNDKKVNNLENYKREEFCSKNVASVSKNNEQNINVGFPKMKQMYRNSNSKRILNTKNEDQFSDSTYENIRTIPDNIRISIQDKKPELESKQINFEQNVITKINNMNKTELDEDVYNYRKYIEKWS